MSDRLVIDVDVIAQASSHLRGRVAAEQFRRLHKVLSGTSGWVDYAVRGRIDPHGRPCLSIELSGGLDLVCQRCLGAVSHAVNVRRELRILADASLLPEVADEKADVDEVYGVERIDVLEWVEDEVLLSLPIAPRHAEGVCQLPGNPARRDDGEINPFAALGGLRGPTRNTTNL